METVRVTPGRFPPTINTTPNSPIVWAKLSTMPVTMPGRARGTTTRQKVARRDTPRHHEASTSRRSTAAKAEVNGWTAKGRL